MGRICQPFVHRGFGVSLHFGQGFMPCASHNVMRGCPCVCQAACAGFAQTMRGTLRQARLVAPFPHKVAKAIGRTALAVSGGKEGSISGAVRKHFRQIGVTGMLTRTPFVLAVFWRRYSNRPPFMFIGPSFTASIRAAPV